MKHKINILIPIFALLVLVYVVRSLVGPHVQAESLQYGRMEDVLNVKGVMIKYESVLSSETAGTLEVSVQEGTRVGAGQQIATVYTGSVDAELRHQLDQVNNKIAQAEKNQADLYDFSGDVSRLEQNITAQTAALIQKSQVGDMAAVNNIQFVLKALCEKKLQITSGNKGNSLLQELKTQKAELEAQIDGARRRITAPCAGVFSSAVDGFESIVTPYNMTELTPSAVDALLEQDQGKTTNNETTACKIIKNFRFFIAVNIPTDKMTGLRSGTNVNLRFYDLSGDLVKAKIFYVSSEEEGYQTVVLESDRYLESLLKRRFVNLEFIKNQHSGYRVSVKALRTKDDVTGVYVRRDDVLKFIPVDILYNSQDVAIVDSASQELPLRLYDEVVVSASSYEEGKLLR